MSESIRISIDSIVFPPENLGARPIPNEKDKNYDQFLILCDDISKHGLLNTPSVVDAGDGKYMVIDGSRRMAAIQKTFKEGNPHESYANGEITVNLRDDKEVDILERSIAGNATVSTMKNSDYFKTLQKVLVARNYTIKELAPRVGLSEQRCTDLLKLNNLPESALKAIDDGKLSLVNAINLNKLPTGRVDALIADATELTGEKFAVKVADEMKAVKASRDAEKGVKKEFTPKARVVAKDEILAELHRVESLAADEESEFNKGRLYEIQKICQMDEQSIVEQKEAFEAKQKEAEEKAKERKVNREAKKKEESIKYLNSIGVKVQVQE